MHVQHSNGSGFFGRVILSAFLWLQLVAGFEGGMFAYLFSLGWVSVRREL